MRGHLALLSVMILLILGGCGKPPLLEAQGSWSISQVDPVKDSSKLEDARIPPNQANKYRLVRYDFTITNKGGKTAEWVAITPTLTPAFEDRRRNRFDFRHNPPHRLSAGASWQVAGTYLLEGHDAELAVLIPENRFLIRWRFQEQEYSAEVEMTTSR